MNPLTPEELKQYVGKRLKKGYPAGELRDELVQQGYTTETIEQAFNPAPTPGDAEKGFGWRSLVVSVILISAYHCSHAGWRHVCSSFQNSFARLRSG
jgi:hypothetical protein